ncbi:MAG: SPOR domain-containing protein [Rhizobiaceae bacterium]
MTDQNNLVRDVSEDNQTEDPLEELARIVSGGIDLDAARKEAEESEDNELEAEIAQQTVEVMAYDLESELMRELGTERFEESPESEGAPSAEELDDISEFGQFDHPVRTNSALEAAATDNTEAVSEADEQIDADLDATLEDQLMAELEPAELEEASSPTEELQEVDEAAPAASARSATEQSATPPDTQRRDTSFASLLPSKEDTDQSAEAAEVDLETGDAVSPQTQSEAGDQQQEEAEDFDFASAFAAEVEAEQELQIESSEQNNNASQEVQGPEGQAEIEQQIEVSVAEVAETAEVLIEQNGAPDEAEVQSDLSAAFEEELTQLGLEQELNAPELAPEPAPEPVPDPSSAEAAAEPVQAGVTNEVISRSPPIPAKADLDDEFARAFAKELDLGSISDAPREQADQFAPVQTDIAPAPVQQTPLQAQAVADSQAQQSHQQTSVDNLQNGIADNSVNALPELEVSDEFANAEQYFEEEFQAVENQLHDDQLNDEELPDEIGTGHRHAQEQPAEHRRGGFKLAAGALVIALLVGAGAIAYSYFSGSSSISAPVTIKADSDPVKVKPDDPGGTMVANQDKAAYERVTGDFATDTRQEKLVKSTETPVDVPGRGVEQAASSPPAVPRDANKEENRLAPNTARNEALATPVLEPRKVKTVTVNPDGTVVRSQSSTPLQAAAPPVDSNSIGGAVSTGQIGVPATRPNALNQPTQVADTSNSGAPLALSPNPAETRLSRSPFPNESSAASAPVANTNTDQVSTASTPIGTAPVQAESEPVKVASATPNPPAPVVSNTSNTAASAGSWAVQISSQRSAEDAQTTYQKMREQYSDVSGNQQMSIQRAEIEGKGVFFRVRVMAQSRDEALDICSKLKSAGGSCFVTQ